MTMAQKVGARLRSAMDNGVIGSMVILDRKRDLGAAGRSCRLCIFARRAVLLLAALILLLAVVEARAQQESLVRVDEVKSQPLTQTVPVIGRLVARRTGNVAARIAAPVDEMLVEVGDRVEEGQIIAVLNAETFKADLALADSEYQEALAEKQTFAAETELAQTELNRQKGLRTSTAFSQARFEDAEQKVSVAAAKVKRAEANILIKKSAMARKRLDVQYASVKAPYAGVIVQRFTENGAYVRSGDPLVRMISDQNLEIEADVPSRRVAGLAPKSEVDFVLDDGTRHKAAVRAVLPSENPLTRTRAVRFVPTFSKVERALAEGQSATLAVPVGISREVVTVHKDAVIRRRGKDIVFVVKDGIAMIREIIIGESVDSRFEVVKGLRAGEIVVTRGNERLLPRAKVRVEKGSS